MMDGHLSELIPDLVKGLWTEAQSAISRAETQVGSFVTKLVERGSVSREEGMQAVDEILKHLQKNREEMAGYFENKLQRLDRMLPVPSKGEVEELKGRVEKIKERLDRLVERIK